MARHPGEINRMRGEMPIPYVRGGAGAHRRSGAGWRRSARCCACTDDGGIERTLIAGRVLYHESLREAVARNIAKDLGDIASCRSCR